MKYLMILSLILPLLSIQQRKGTDAKNSGKINGVWIAAPQHNTLLHSPEATRKQLSMLKSQGVNTLFLCVWADNKTAFKSNVLLQNSNYRTVGEGWMFDSYVPEGSPHDPVAFLIRQAHAEGMKVIFWFEYGFMAQWGKEPDPGSHPILAAKPHWAGKGNDGKTTNYNGSDYYFNAYHPEVQQFLLDLIAESLELYPEVDGIQGDDRLPASPANSGYDPFTVGLYQKNFGGSAPPADFRDPEWFKWRIGLLNDFAARLHRLVKEKNKSYLMAFSPNPYPWCLENLMQDWPSWVRSGYVDQLNVQCYRTNMNSYVATVTNAFETATAAGLEKSRFVPGIILGIASKRMVNNETLDSILYFNALQGYGGQSLFYVKWLTEDSTLGKTVRKRQR